MVKNYMFAMRFLPNRFYRNWESIQRTERSDVWTAPVRFINGNSLTPKIIVWTPSANFFKLYMYNLTAPARLAKFWAAATRLSLPLVKNRRRLAGVCYFWLKHYQIYTYFNFQLFTSHLSSAVHLIAIYINLVGFFFRNCRVQCLLAVF